MRVRSAIGACIRGAAIEQPSLAPLMVMGWRQAQISTASLPSSNPRLEMATVEVVAGKAFTRRGRRGPRSPWGRNRAARAKGSSRRRRGPERPQIGAGSTARRRTADWAGKTTPPERRHFAPPRAARGSPTAAGRTPRRGRMRRGRRTRARRGTLLAPWPDGDGLEPRLRVDGSCLWGQLGRPCFRNASRRATLSETRLAGGSPAFSVAGAGAQRSYAAMPVSGVHHRAPVRRPPLIAAGPNSRTARSAPCPPSVFRDFGSRLRSTARQGVDGGRSRQPRHVRREALATNLDIASCAAQRGTRSGDLGDVPTNRGTWIASGELTLTFPLADIALPASPPNKANG